MPVRGRGAFPKPSAVHREEGSGSGGGVIVEYRALKKLQNSSEALNILRRIGASVRPIMIKHGWRLPLLVEMYPKQDNLLGLNVNRGKKIALRLRRPYNDLDFIDEESITETMLHELAHNLRGPHDEIFFQHLETLTQEFYDLRANRPLPGLGFMSAGQKLGGSGLISAADSAQRRRNISQIIGSGSNRVGGSAIADLSPREAAAAAAHRRKVISMGCPSSNLASTQEANEEQEQQELLHGVEVITIGDDDEEDDDDDFEIIENGQTQKEEDSDDEIVVTAVKRPKKEESSTAMQSGSWNCQTCTLLNDRYAETCAACESVRPGVDCWVCRSCQHRMIGTYAAFWCCTQCQTVKVA
ncbi:WLM-domain-containing protein [Meira miltonrushii]|uniref:WLM-domain-containing protein n=1 Tax=Meira miltonrushii TaxID=1280837 RepID=A0A316VBG5_9BASI|nr:WLM-domain-containing protein [Meira miltonrushii]PWN33573.1 WLM-domain-containing protein [Meira miltonrushii]